VNLLNTGPRTTGARKVKTALSATTAIDPGIHQRSGKRRMSATSTSAPPPARTASMPHDFATSLAHGPQSWVESP
jgi:hypothetical protein